MSLENLGALAAVVLAGSVIMERFVTIVKTFFPNVFGESGPDPEAIYRDVPLRTEPLRDPNAQRHLVKIPLSILNPKLRDIGGLGRLESQMRKVRVQYLVVAASLTTAFLVSDSCPDGVLCRNVTYGSGLSLPWLFFAFLISGGSAFWAQIVGLVGAIKDARTEQQRQPTVIVVDPRDKPRLEPQSG